MAGPSRQDLPPRPPTPAGDLGALRVEFQKQGVGPLLVSEVRCAAYGIVSRYNAAVYSEIGNWRHGFDDLVQDVVADSLLRDRQAEYMLDVAATIGDLRRLLVRQIRRCLARRRLRTVVDNVLGRARRILVAPPFEQRTRHLQVTFLMHGAAVEDRAATYRELRAGADALRSVPQRVTAIGDRAPIVYTTPDLKRALQRFGTVMPVAFTIGELDRALRLALPHLLPSVLDSVGEYDDVDHHLVRTRSSALLRGLDRPVRAVVAMKVAGCSDAEVGQVLDVSRRTATNRKAAAFELIEDVLQDLKHGERVAVLDLVGPELRAALIQTRASTSI